MRKYRNLPDKMSDTKSTSKLTIILVTQLTTPSNLSVRKITFPAAQLFCCCRVSWGHQQMKKIYNDNDISRLQILSKELVCGYNNLVYFEGSENHCVYVFVQT